MCGMIALLLFATPSLVVQFICGRRIRRWEREGKLRQGCYGG